MSSNNFGYVFDAPQEFLVLNSTDEWIELVYDSESVFVPPTDQVLTKARFDMISGKNSEGEFIPGSALVRDIPGSRSVPSDSDPMDHKRGEFWSAAKCIKHCLGVRSGTLEGTTLLALKGVSLLPLNPSPEMVRKTREAGLERFKEHQIQWANGTMHAYEESAAKRKSLNISSQIPGKDYARAAKILAEARGQMDDLKAQAYGEGASTDDEAVLFARQLAEQAAWDLKKDKPEVDIDALVENLMANPDFKRKMKESYNLKKKRGPNKSKVAEQA